MAKQQAAPTPTQIIKSWSLRRYSLLHEAHKKSKGQDKMVELSATKRYFYLSHAGCKCLHPPSGSYLWRCCPGTAERGSSSYFYRTQRNWTGSDPASNDHYNTHTYIHGRMRRCDSSEHNHSDHSVSAWGIIFMHAIKPKLWLIYDRLSNSDIKKGVQWNYFITSDRSLFYADTSRHHSALSEPTEPTRQVMN